MRRLSPSVRLLVLELCLPLLVVALCEVGFRWYVARTPEMPLPKLFAQLPMPAGKFYALRARAEHLPTLDVVLMGLSPMMRVSGEQLEAALSEKLRRPITVFNYAGSIQSVAFDERLLREVIMPIAKPRIVVYGLTPLSMSNERLTTKKTDQMWESQPVFGVYTGSPAARLRGFLTMHIALLEYREVLRDLFKPPFGWKP